MQAMAVATPEAATAEPQRAAQTPRHRQSAAEQARGRHPPIGNQARLRGVVRRACAACEEERRPKLHAKSVGALPSQAPPSVHQALSGAGRPLAPELRSDMEAGFGRDFDAVRVHTDGQAAASASEINSLAYTVGDHIVFAGGQYAPHSSAGRHLLAHELAHVAQQPSGQVQSKLTIGDVDSPAEREADRAADAVAAGGDAGTIGSATTGVVRRAPAMSCLDLLTPEGLRAPRVDGNHAHDAIETYFKGQVGKGFWSQEIPDASSTPLRTEDRNPRTRRDPTANEVVNPQTIGGRAGRGQPDLGYRSGPIVEVAEVKPATLEYGVVGGLVEGMGQVLNYVEHGNSPENAGWRGRRRITSVIAMPPSRADWPDHLMVDGHEVMVRWCLPGLIGYRPKSDDEADTILCGVSDKGLIDRFLNTGLDKAGSMLDQGFDKSMEAIFSKKINALTLADGVKYLAKHAGGFIQNFLSREHSLKTEIALSIFGDDVAMVGELLSDEQMASAMAEALEDEFGAAAEAKMRQIAVGLKTQLFAAAKKRVKDGLRHTLEESMAALCTAAAVGVAVSMAQLMAKFAEQFGKLLGDALEAVVKDLVVAAAKAIITAIAVAVAVILVAVAVALFIFLLPELIALIAVALEGLSVALAGLAAEAAALGAEVPGLLARIIPALAT